MNIMTPQTEKDLALYVKLAVHTEDCVCVCVIVNLAWLLQIQGDMYVCYSYARDQ